jgi:acetyltransferase-like isoleucine patch superfamily enzyme
MKNNKNSKVLQEVREGGGGFFDRLILKIVLRSIRILLRYKKNQYNRVVSFGDLLIDRTEKAKLLSFGEGTTIYDSSLVIGDVKVGKNTWIGPFTILDGSGGLEIGDNCSIASGVQIYSHETIDWALSGGKMRYKQAKTIIGNCCYIGPQSIISKGVKIGNHCLVGAKSLVTSNIDDYSIGAGSPCKVIGKVKIDDEGNVELVMNHGSKTQ